MNREPAVAGQFYSYDNKNLLAELNSCFSLAGKPGNNKNTNKILALVCPHAGYAYSGKTAAFSFRALAEDRTFNTAVIIGPNHTGFGPDVSVFPRGAWTTPLGDVAVDEKLAARIGKSFSLDESAHLAEHSIEVQVPFLQFLFREFKIVPICVLDQSLKTMQQLGQALAKTLDPTKHVVIASSDFSHYVPNKVAYANDLACINELKKLDEASFFKAIDRTGCSACGPGPIAAALAYAKMAGAKTGQLLKYMTSGDVTGDNSAVVGYASIIFSK